MSSAIDANPVAFRVGQVDALAKGLLASPVLYPADMRGSLALHWLTRAWAQYRKDRAISLGPALIGAECSAERNAFLTLLERALPAGDPSPALPCLAQAIRLVRRIAIRPLASEAAETETIVATSMADLDAVLAALGRASLPDDPLERLLALVSPFRYSIGDVRDALSATARTLCWAINLAATARGDAFRLSEGPLPFPGLVQRGLFRADRSAAERRELARKSLLDALHATACDMTRMPRAAAIFARDCAGLRSNSRLALAWMLLFGLGGMTAAQLARALPATKAGAGKLLRQLEDHNLVRGQGPFAPYVCAFDLPMALPDWRHQVAG